MDSTTPTPRRGTDARRQAIVEAALKVLETHGHAGFTARRVAGEAQMSLGHLTYNFTDMAEILAAAFALAAERMQALAEARISLPGATHAERLQAFLTALVAPETLPDSLLRVRVDLWAAARGVPALQATEAALNEALRGRIAQLLDLMADSWKAERIPAVTDLILAALEGLWLDRARKGDGARAASVIESCVMFARLRLG